MTNDKGNWPIETSNNLHNANRQEDRSANIKARGDELIEKFYFIIHNTHLADWLIMQKATKCAIIAVEEIIKYQNVVLSAFPSDEYEPQYWNEVLNYLKSKQ